MAEKQTRQQQRAEMRASLKHSPWRNILTPSQACNRKTKSDAERAEMAALRHPECPPKTPAP